MYKQTSEYKSIHKKLVAAVAMVLVACLMVVSSSYAWFTLSTAPEVTGITTSVGSNGNLEMALNATGDLDDITTGTNVRFPDANNYWGNLVDLSDASYNLDKISLAPARLNASGSINAAGTASGAQFSDGGFLLTPVYGADGRVADFETGSETGKLTGEDFFADANHYGVRAVGVPSGLSAGAKALRDARNAVTGAKSTVTRLARTSLEVDAINLASIIIAKELDASKSTVTSTEWDQVVAAVDNLEAIATQLKTAMDKVVSAVAVSQDVDMTGKTITYSASGVTVADTTLSMPAELNAALGKAYTTWTSIDSKVSSARGTIDGATPDGGTYAYTTVETIMTQILSIGDIKIAGETLSGKDKTAITGIVMNAYLDNEGKLPMNIVSGIYADIEAFIGAYSASAKMNVSLAGTQYETNLDMSSVNITAQMRVENGARAVGDGADADSPDDDVLAYYLDYFVVQLSGLTASDSGTGTGASPLDVYGYAIDLAFRTNAANSNLMLQTAAVSRVGDDTSAAVQGGGSYMEFTIGSTTNGYTLDQMEDLMGAIRVVLKDTESNEIYAVAALSMGDAERNDTAGTIKAFLYLYEFEIGNNGVLVLGEKIVTDNTDGTKTAITSLTQNQALAMTALVYLDGDYVDNSDVAISGESMSGTINLQFSSSADLVPMDYTFDQGEKLDAPEASFTGDVLTINPVTNAEKYEVYYLGVKVGEVAADGTLTFDLSTKIGELTAGLTQDTTFTFQVYAVPASTQTEYTKSEATEVTYNFTYTPPAP